MPAETSGTCPDDDTLALFVNGGLDGPGESAIRSHMGSCEACRKLIAVASHGPRAESDTYVERDFLAGKYRIEGELGSGGMGTVYRARHLALERDVAIKLLHPHLLKEVGILRRFEQEARAAARLQSLHAVKVIDIDWLPTGTPFIVMEYLEGCDLAVLIDREGPFSQGRAVRYTLEACQALAEAHAKGIIHRDLKPQNLFLSSDKSEGVVKVLDFGLAKIFDGRRALGTESVTGAGDVLGSPYYMSPEQISSSGVDTRTDVWSMGATLYMMLSGQSPFVGPNLTILRSRILGGEPRPMSMHRADIPAGLEEVVKKCLRVKPDERWPTIEAFAAALRAFEVPVDATATTPSTKSLTFFPETLPMPAKRAARQRGLRLSAGIGLAAIVMIATALAVRHAPVPDASVARAIVPPPVEVDPAPPPPTSRSESTAPTTSRRAEPGGEGVAAAASAKPASAPRPERPASSQPKASGSAAPFDPFSLPRTQ